MRRPMSNLQFAPTILLACLLASSPLLAQTAPGPQPLARHYQLGEKIAYTLSCFNQSRTSTTEYEATVQALVGKDPTGALVENFAWTDLSVNDNQVHLSPASLALREPLSLVPGVKLALPDLSKVQPALVAPAADLLTFYADLKIALNQHSLQRAGDRAYVPFSAPNSWANGAAIILGQDSVDFEVVFTAIDPAPNTATIVVHHVPPDQPQLKLPARWMNTPIADLHNNWVQVEKRADGKYAAAIGQETFDVEFKLDLTTGRILSATLDNPIEASERICDDAALATCGDPTRYTLRRQITLRANPESAAVPQK